jgi:DNA-binding IclR family transcriptional regulator
MAPVLNEQGRRRFVALEALQLGRGGVSLMARISGLARSTIYRGLSDLRNKASARLRRSAPRPRSNRCALAMAVTSRPLDLIAILP